MKYKDFSEQIWTSLNQKIKFIADEKKLSGKKYYAAFDADGTLWDIDLGETFFQYQIDQRLVELPSNAWDHYLNLKTGPGGPDVGYLWLAQINENQNLSTVRKWASEAIGTASPLPIFSEQKRLIQLLQENDIEVFVVTASVKWAVEPGAAQLGIDHDHVIGIETDVTDSGLITRKQKGVITYKKGKVDGLLQRTKGIYPFFASGNTEGDLALLESATDLRLAVSAASRDDRLFKTESQLQQIAIARGWMTHRFVLSEG